MCATYFLLGLSSNETERISSFDVSRSIASIIWYFFLWKLMNLSIDHCRWSRRVSNVQSHYVEHGNLMDHGVRCFVELEVESSRRIGVEEGT